MFPHKTDIANISLNLYTPLFNDYLNSEKRKMIKDECNKKSILYKNKLDKVIELLQDLVQDAIIFASESNIKYKYNDIDEKDIHTCISQTNDKCLDNKKMSICRITKDKCQLVLPKINLVNRSDNEIVYINIIY